jgi:hypothetical protein
VDLLPSANGAQHFATRHAPGVLGGPSSLGAYPRPPQTTKSCLLLQPPASCRGWGPGPGSRKKISARGPGPAVGIVTALALTHAALALAQ